MLRAIAFGLVGLVVIESRFLFVCDVTTVTAPTRPSCWTFRPRTDWREAGMSGVISEGGERLRVFLDGKTRATKRGPKIAPRDVVTAAAQAFARNEIDRAELMRRITPSLSR
jgi:hypothetical protein